MKANLTPISGRYQANDVVFYMYQYSSRFPVFYRVDRVTEKSIYITAVSKYNFGYTLGGGSYKAIPNLDRIEGRSKRLSIRPDGYAYITYYGHLERLEVWSGSPVDCFSD